MYFKMAVKNSSGLLKCLGFFPTSNFSNSDSLGVLGHSLA